MTASSAVQLYEKLVVALDSCGLAESEVLFDSTYIPEPTKHLSYRIVPGGPLSPSLFSTSVDVGFSTLIYVAFQQRPESDASLVKDEVFPVLDRIIDAFAAMEEFDPSVPIEAAIQPDEEQRFLVLVLSSRMRYARNRS